VSRPSIARADRRGEVSATLVLVAGSTILLLRPSVTMSSPSPIPVLAALSVAIGAAAIALPVPGDRDRPALPAGFVLSVGVAAVLLAAQTAGRPVPIPWAAEAPVLNTLAAVAEEALFRRVAYARLHPHGAIVAVVGTALLFALLHVPLYGVAAFPVDLGAGLLLSWQRWASGTWSVPAATHVAANLLVMIR
jgi:membrane protease YdiL (CAAX protease family)